MTFTFTIADGIGPNIAELYSRADGPKKALVLEAMGMAAQAWAVEAFTDSTKRPAAWKNKRDGTASTLQGAGNPVLRRSLRVVAEGDSVTIGTDRKYALIHQLGGVINAKAGGALHFMAGGKWFTVKKVTMPARPYLPVMASGTIMPAAAENIGDAALDTLTDGL